MGYTRPENLGSHGDKRIVGILSLTNIVGGLCGLAGMWQLGALLGLEATGLNVATFLRVVLALSGGAVGVFATFRWSGMSLWDQVWLWVAYQTRRSTGGTLIKPPPTARRSGAAAGFTTITQGGQVIAEVYDPNTTGTLEAAHGD